MAQRKEISLQPVNSDFEGTQGIVIADHSGYFLGEKIRQWK